MPLNIIICHLYHDILTFCSFVVCFHVEFQCSLEVLSFHKSVADGGVVAIKVDSSIGKEGDGSSLNVLLHPLLLVMFGQVIVALKVVGRIAHIPCHSINGKLEYVD